MTACYHFHGDLVTLLRRRWRTTQPIVQPVSRAASIKDVIESFGVPHTEVERIACDGQPTDFSHLVRAGQHFDIHPITAPWDVTRPTPLRPEPLTGIRFIVDGNVGRLGRYLRMAGFDTLYDPRWDSKTLLGCLGEQPRIVLTRDLDLLKRKQVVFGRYIRADKPVGQLREVLALFGLGRWPRPFARCLDCNTPLEPVDKQRIVHRLEPLTRRYFERFTFCPHCDKIYWAGSHVERMKADLAVPDSMADQ
ncbi:protein of unknown function DUF82 [Desulfobulbus propionicus DSM 2032]|uniref:Twitching motility protein PilT n=2 Tax=Desulfobulbus propionicus TaxID=894 RepID=A0A7U4DPX5_DESPD|nr:protein of unknown function DUF82 [Desulfobulbus propionicus DSM 2032]